MTIRVGVFGAGGRMGSAVCQGGAAYSEGYWVGGGDPHHGGLYGGGGAGPTVGDLQIAHDADSLVAAGAQVVVDFTHLDAARANLAWLAEAGIHAVVGTTGFDDVDLARFRSEFIRSNCVIAPNFAIGAILMMRLAADAAPYFETAEVIEYHHDQKVDAPSGTAMLTAERIAEASAQWADDPTTTTVVEGARGGEAQPGVRIHSVRMRGMVAHQEVVLGTTGQTLTIRHDSYDRTSFMPGVVMAAKAIADRPGVTVGLDVLLDL